MMVFTSSFSRDASTCGVGISVRGLVLIFLMAVALESTFEVGMEGFSFGFISFLAVSVFFFTITGGFFTGFFLTLVLFLLALLSFFATMVGFFTGTTGFFAGA